MEKIDCERNRHLAERLVAHSAETMIFAATADCDENYGIDDLWVSAFTIGGWIALPMENKTILGGYRLKYGDEWNDYFDTTNTRGIMRKLSGDTIPESGHIYFVNAYKFKKLIDYNACLAYLAPDGFILFSPHTLKKAFLGYAYYKNKSHTEEYSPYYNPHWEEKALIDLEVGTYYKDEGPIEIFMK